MGGGGGSWSRKVCGGCCSAGGGSAGSNLTACERSVAIQGPSRPRRLHHLHAPRDRGHRVGDAQHDLLVGGLAHDAAQCRHLPVRGAGMCVGVRCVGRTYVCVWAGLQNISECPHESRKNQNSPLPNGAARQEAAHARPSIVWALGSNHALPTRPPHSNPIGLSPRTDARTCCETESRPSSCRGPARTRYLRRGKARATDDDFCDWRAAQYNVERWEARANDGEHSLFMDPSLSRFLKGTPACSSPAQNACSARTKTRLPGRRVCTRRREPLHSSLPREPATPQCRRR